MTGGGDWDGGFFGLGVHRFLGWVCERVSDMRERGRRRHIVADYTNSLNPTILLPKKSSVQPFAHYPMHIHTLSVSQAERIAARYPVTPSPSPSTHALYIHPSSQLNVESAL